MIWWILHTTGPVAQSSGHVVYAVELASLAAISLSFCRWHISAFCSLSATLRPLKPSSLMGNKAAGHLFLASLVQQPPCFSPSSKVLHDNPSVCTVSSGLWLHVKIQFLLLHSLKNMCLFWHRLCICASSSLYPNTTLFLLFPLTFNLLLELPALGSYFQSCVAGCSVGKSSLSNCCHKCSLASRCVSFCFSCCACAVSPSHVPSMSRYRGTCCCYFFAGSGEGLHQKEQTDSATPAASQRRPSQSQWQFCSLLQYWLAHKCAICCPCRQRYGWKIPTRRLYVGTVLFVKQMILRQVGWFRKPILMWQAQAYTNVLLILLHVRLLFQSGLGSQKVNAEVLTLGGAFHLVPVS